MMRYFKSLKFNFILLTCITIFQFTSCKKKETQYVSKSLVSSILQKELDSIYNHVFTNYISNKSEDNLTNLRYSIGIYDNMVFEDTLKAIKTYRLAAQTEGMQSNHNQALETVKKLVRLHEQFSNKNLNKLISDYHFYTRNAVDNGQFQNALVHGVSHSIEISTKIIKNKDSNVKEVLNAHAFLLNSYNTKIVLFMELGYEKKLGKLINTVESHLAYLDHINLFDQNDDYPILNDRIRYHAGNAYYHLSKFYKENHKNEKYRNYKQKFFGLHHPHSEYEKLTHIIRELRLNNQSSKLDLLYAKAQNHYKKIVDNKVDDIVITDHYMNNKAVRLLAEITSRYAELKFEKVNDKIEYHKKAIGLFDKTIIDYETHPLFSLEKLYYCYWNTKNQEKLEAVLKQYQFFENQLTSLKFHRKRLLLESKYAARYGSLETASNSWNKYLETFKNSERPTLIGFSNINDIREFVDLIKIVNQQIHLQKDNNYPKEVFKLYSYLLDFIANNASNITTKERSLWINYIEKNSIDVLLSLDKREIDPYKFLLKLEEISIPVLSNKVNLQRHREGRLLVSLQNQIEDLSDSNNAILEELSSSNSSSTNQNLKQEFNKNLIEINNRLEQLNSVIPGYNLFNPNGAKISLNQKEINSDHAILKIIPQEDHDKVFLLSNNMVEWFRIDHIDYALATQSWFSRANDFQSIERMTDLNQNYARAISKFKHLYLIPHSSKKLVPMDFYAGKNNALSYINSLRSYPDQTLSKRKNNPLAFTPSYNGMNASMMEVVERTGTYDLPFAKEEAQFVSDLFDGTYFTDSLATKMNYINNASNHNIHHLAMHAVVDEKDNYNAKLLFQGDSEEDYLNLDEIYNLNLDVDLVTLSACNTAYGKIDPIEGALSLSRAFQYAGARATLTSLWRVPDRETSIIMKSFYTHLKDGERKDMALKMAKDDYLNAQVEEEFKHPYYWAGFILTGDPSPIILPTPWWHYALYIAVGIVLLIVFISLSRKRNKA